MIAVGLRLRSAGAGRASWQRGRVPRSRTRGGAVAGAVAGAGPAARRSGSDSRRAAAPRPRHSLRADINITPLVDVVLVLLIIFMVVTPMLSKGVNVDLPITQHHDKRGDDNRDIVVAITHLGQIYVGSTPVSLDRLAGAVTEERRHHPDKAIFLKGDTRIDYGQARLVMEALHRVGVEQIQLGTEEEAGSR